MDKNVLRVTDIEHIHWSLSEAEVPKSVVLDDKPMSLAAAVELLIIGAHYRALDGANSSVYSTVRATNWPVAGTVGSTRVGTKGLATDALLAGRTPSTVLRRKRDCGYFIEWW